jgi:hypothetical protein
MSIHAEGGKPTPPLCADCFSKRTAAAVQRLKGNGMPKVRATVDTESGEVHEDQQMFSTDLRQLEKQIALAYGELIFLKAAKDESATAHKEGQEKLNGLVAELTRIVNGEQKLPLA